ncbi:Ras- protein Rab-21 [Branchiostoma belcheri]|nr:Ras- protein Rab-21 [Branchiostoma belcheri]
MAAGGARGHQFKVVLLGEGCVGKTSLVLRYCEDKFNDKHISTLQASFLTKKLNIAGKRVNLAIWDTAGQERFHALGPIYYRDSNGAILVYDITDEDSFQKVKNWVKELRKMLGSEVTLCIAGNKIDLEKQRNVPAEEAEAYATSVGAKHFHTSAKLNKGVEEMFLDLTKRMLEKDTNSKPDATAKPGSTRRNIQITEDEPQEQKNRKKCKKRKACPTDTPVGHYRTCALVGNGGILLKSNCGNEIDSHDYVIRMNMAALKNYEQDVGRQTNLSFINWKRIKELGKEITSKKKKKEVLQHLTLLNGSVFSYVKLKTKDAISALESLETILKNNSLNITVTYSRSNVPLVFTRPLRETFIPRLKSPTSGLIAYILASRFCDVITMYGFYPFATDMRNRTLFYHYYDKSSIAKKRRSRHNFIIEHNFFTLLHNNGLVRLVTDICE